MIFCSNAGYVLLERLQIVSNKNIIVSVSDTGIGMSKDTQAHIFERYYQGDKSHSLNGHGLGLSIVQRIVRLCDGTIAAQSKEGEGSTFTVTLPK